MHRDVVITGIGIVSAAGVGADAAWRALEAGEVCLGPMSLLDASGFPCRLGGEVVALSARDFVPKSYRKATKVMARDTEIAVVAAQLALADAGLSSRGSGETAQATTGDGHRAISPVRTGCQIGAGLLSAEINELTGALATSTSQPAPEGGVFDAKKWGGGEGGENAMGNLPPLWMLKYLPNMLSCHVTIIHGAEGPSNTITCAESSGLLCLGESSRVIERGDADACFSGGAESKINPLGLLRLTFAKRLAETGASTDAAEFAMPYAPESTGGLPSEGGAILMVESAENADGRSVYAQIAGFGAGHTAAPIFPGVFDEPADVSSRVDEGLRRAVRAAMDDAGVGPDEIDAIVPGALGVPLADAGELNALREVFGARLASIETITVSPSLGVSAAGHGAMLAAVGALAIKHQRLPARLHAGGTVPDDFRVGPRAAGDASLHTVLVCSPSLGGQVGALVLRRVGGTA